jgi:uncharacterized lipoprotein
MKSRPLLLSVVAASLLLASGCRTVLGSCHKQQPYEKAGNLPTLKVPSGLDGPDTEGAMEIPEIAQPELPLDPDGPCIDAPPAITAPPLPATPEYDLSAAERLSRSPADAEAAREEEESRPRRRRPPSRPR